MTCPMCRGTGKITVVNVDKTANVGRDELRPCPMNCKPPLDMMDDGGISGNGSLEGNERTLDDYKASRGRNRVAWKTHYLGRDE